MGTFKPKGKKNYKSKPNNYNRPYVYLMTDGRYYKIGSSMNPFRRLKQLKTASPKIKLLGYYKKKTEEQLHKKFKKWKVAGEWFNLPKYEVDMLLCDMHTPKKAKSLNEIKQISLDEYLIPYGEYKGRKLITMESVDEIRYIRKQIRELPKHCEEWAMFTRWNLKWSEKNSIQ